MSAGMMLNVQLFMRVVVVLFKLEIDGRCQAIIFMGKPQLKNRFGG